MRLFDRLARAFVRAHRFKPGVGVWNDKSDSCSSHAIAAAPAACLVQEHDATPA